MDSTQGGELKLEARSLYQQRRNSLALLARATNRSGSVLRGLLAVLAVFVATMLPLSAAVRFDMFVGYDGIVPQGSWFPVAFEVQNDGAPFTAVVELTPGQFNSSQTRTMVVELPTGTTKRFIIPSFASAAYNPTWNARLLDERGKVRAETSSQRVRRLNDSVVPLAAAVTRALPPLPEVKNRQDELRPVFGRLQPSVFPDHPIALEGLDALYLSSERVMELKMNQVGPLLAWLYGGGHLIVSLEQINHLSGPGEWLKQLLPCEVTGMTSLASHGEIQEWLAGQLRFDGVDSQFDSVSRRNQPRGASAPSANPYAKLLPDEAFERAPIQVATIRKKEGRTLIGSDAAPLAVIAHRGRGQITVLTFAPELEPFRGWKNAPYFWAKMINIPPEVLANENVNRYPGRPVDGVFGAMIDSKQVRKLPVGWLLLLLVGYLVVIGPLDQYWLKKLNKQMLTWITFPAYVAFFSLLIYFIGYKLRAGETEWNELHIVDVMPHGEGADLRGRSFGSIYSPVNARYSFGSDLPFSTLRGEFSGNFGGGQEASRATVEQRATGFQASAPVPVWTSQMFVGDWWRQGPSPLVVTLTERDVTIQNNLETKLSVIRLVAAGEVIDLGGLEPRESKTFPRTGAGVKATKLSEFVQMHGGSFADAVNSRQQAFGSSGRSQIGDPINATMAASFVTQLNAPNDYNSFSTPPGFDLTDLTQRGDAVVLAWAPGYTFTKPLNQFPARRGGRDTLIRLSIPVR